MDISEEWPAFQWGKEITLYFHAEVVHWQELLDEITKKFVEAGIEPWSDLKKMDTKFDKLKYSNEVLYEDELRQSLQG